MEFYVCTHILVVFDLAPQQVQQRTAKQAHRGFRHRPIKIIQRPEISIRQTEDIFEPEYEFPQLIPSVGLAHAAFTRTSIRASASALDSVVRTRSKIGGITSLISLIFGLALAFLVTSPLTPGWLLSMEAFVAPLTFVFFRAPFALFTGLSLVFAFFPSGSPSSVAARFEGFGFFAATFFEAFDCPFSFAGIALYGSAILEHHTSLPFGF
jgi:hypothetical protein